MSLNRELAALFARMAALLEIKGEPVFKSIAFARVGRLLDDLTVDLRAAVEDGSLATIEGIGASSRRVIEQYVRDGRSDDYESLAASVPGGLVELLEIPSLGPKTIGLFWKQRDVASLDELKRALADGRLEGLKGIGPKKLQAIRDGIDLREKARGRVGIVEARPLADDLLRRVRALPGVASAEIAGSLRRGRETIGDIDIVCALGRGGDGAAVAAAFVRLPHAQRVLGEGTTKASILTHDGVQADLRIVPPECFGATLMYFTGSKEHNVRIRGRAQARGLTLNEWGLFRADEYERAEKRPGEPPACPALASVDEPSIYAALGLAYIEPELREDRGEVDAAERAALPALVRREDYRGDLHTHTTASDGTASIEAMVEAAMARGHAFLAITDHSKSQGIASGLTVERLMSHVAEIRRVAAGLRGFTLLAGSEVDILADGRLDYEDEVLAELDVVVASPHLALKQEPAKATERLLRAVENRHVHILGHPTGRLIGRRDGLAPDWSRLLPAAADAGVALEINSAWPRLDLDDRLARAALDAGALLAIDTDAHSVDGFDQIDLGITVARRAWATPSRVLNCMEPASLTTWLKAKRA